MSTVVSVVDSAVLTVEEIDGGFRSLDVNCNTPTEIVQGFFKLFLYDRTVKVSGEKHLLVLRRIRIIDTAGM